MNDPIRLALIYGSTREGHPCDTGANWAANDIWSRNDFILDLIDSAELDLTSHHGQMNNTALRELRDRLGNADAFLVVTPEYKHGYLAALKFVVNSAHREWQAKPRDADSMRLNAVSSGPMIPRRNWYEIHRPDLFL